MVGRNRWERSNRPGIVSRRRRRLGGISVPRDAEKTVNSIIAVCLGSMQERMRSNKVTVDTLTSEEIGYFEKDVRAETGDLIDKWRVDQKILCKTTEAVRDIDFAITNIFTFFYEQVADDQSDGIDRNIKIILGRTEKELMSALKREVRSWK
jgi:hypothetical protein